jgi:hypothetical protein
MHGAYSPFVVEWLGRLRKRGSLKNLCTAHIFLRGFGCVLVVGERIKAQKVYGLVDLIH